MKKLLSLVLVTMMIVISASTMVAFAEVGTPTWNGTTLTWGGDATATSYTVNLYNTGYLVKTVNVAGATSYDFASDMTAYGSYFATVTPAGGTASGYSANNVVGTNLAMDALQKLDGSSEAGAALNGAMTDGDATTAPYIYLYGGSKGYGIRFQLCDDNHLATVKSYAFAAAATSGVQSMDLYYSDDGADWTKAETSRDGKVTTGVAATNVYTLPTAVSCRWIKLVTECGAGTATSANGDKNKGFPSEIAVFGDVASYVPLDSIKMDGADLTGFSSNQTSYSIDLIEGTALPVISATTAVEGADVNVAQATLENPVATITSTKGTAVMTYTVAFNIVPKWKHYNLAQGKVDSSNSGKNFYGGSDASKALDGDLATMANPKSGGSNIVIDMGNSVEIGSVGIIEYINPSILKVVKMYYSDTAADDSWKEITLDEAAIPTVGKYNHAGTLKDLRLHICEVGEVNARYFKVETTSAINELLLFPVQEFSYEASFSALTRGEKPTATFTATNDKIYDVPANCTCIFAIYKDGELFDIVTDDVAKTVTSGTSEAIASFTGTKVLPEDGVITVKGFIWNSMDKMVPLAPVLEP